MTGACYGLKKPEPDPLPANKRNQMRAIRLFLAHPLECGSKETVSKRAWIGLSALDSLSRSIPGALPRADIDRAFGPLIL
jgi:hypothetical protein